MTWPRRSALDWWTQKIISCPRGRKNSRCPNSANACGYKTQSQIIDVELPSNGHPRSMNSSYLGVSLQKWSGFPLNGDTALLINQAKAPKPISKLGTPQSKVGFLLVSLQSPTIECQKAQLRALLNLDSVRRAKNL